MNWRVITVLCIFVVLSRSELLGPDAKKKSEKSSDSEIEQSDTLDTEAKVDPEYIKELTEAVNKEIVTLQEYADVIRRTKVMTKEEENKGKIPESHLEQMEYTLKLLRKSLLRQTEPNWIHSSKDELGKDFETQHEDPQDILNSLPPVPEEEEPELPPELKEAKELFDAATAKLNRRSPDVRSAILQVKLAADAGYIPAKIKLAWAYLFGEGLEMDIDKGKAIFEELVAEGNAEAHAGMGFLYATGIGVPVSQGRALVHYTAGAAGDSALAQMALGYRHWAGVSLPSSCHNALDFYMKVAAKAKELFDAATAKLNRRSPDVRSAILQVKLAADAGYIPAKIKLAWAYLFGEGLEMDIDKGKAIFEELVAEGNAEAHAGMGFLYATGIGVPVSQGRALVHYTAGAAGDSALAQMALGYRHWAGVSLPSSCHNALDFYMKVAAKVASKVSLNGGPAIQRARLIDEAEGGGGGGALDTDLIEYYQLLAEKGDVQAQVGLGQLHFQGGRGVTLDINKALHYFKQAAKTGNAVANAFLGKIFLEGGDGIKADNETALRYFRKAAELNNPVGQSGLGIMYLQGRGVPRDTAAALKYFTMAANQGWVEGQLHLGFMYFGGIGVRRDFKQANKYFSLASQSGHVLALYHLGQMHAQGLGVLRSCTTALELFKNVCERGGWGSRLMAAHAAWRSKNPHSAFMQYLELAERGLEVAQTNAAYLLDTGEVRLFPEQERFVRALQLWRRAASQGCASARVKLGDYYYYGMGAPVDLEAAAHHYRIASEQLHNAQATFNLGYMHERGLGLARDLHLAKRCYDMAADTAPEARLPAALALAKLNTVTALASIYESVWSSPWAMVFLAGDSPLLANWDVYLIAALLGALGLVVYLRRPQPPLVN